MKRNGIADRLGFSRRTTFYKEKRAFAYDFQLEGVQSPQLNSDATTVAVRRCPNLAAAAVRRGFKMSLR